MIGSILVETSWTTPVPGDGTVAHKHVLHVEPGTGRILYNRIQADGSGWNTQTFHDDYEKALRYFLREVAKDTYWEGDDDDRSDAITVDHVLNAMQESKRKSVQSFVERRTREQSKARFSKIIDSE